MSKPFRIHEIDLDRLQEVLDYDPETGIFMWRVRIGGMCKFDRPAGVIRAGYRTIGIDGKVYHAHQLAWLYVYHEAPEGELDFINGDKTDIRISNLRPATRADNARNARSQPNKTGFRGVQKFRNCYRAYIRTGTKRLFLGTFATAEGAYEAYCAKAKEVHGEFARLK